MAVEQQAKPLKNQRVRADRRAVSGREALENKTFTATSRYLRISPRKLRLVAELVRGKYIDEADSILKVCPKRGAPMILKTLKSAVSNGTYHSRRAKIQLDVPHLKINRIDVNEGPTIKRIRPSSERRPYLIRKRFSHLYIELKELLPTVVKAEDKSPVAGMKSSPVPATQPPPSLPARESAERAEQAAAEPEKSVEPTAAATFAESSTGKLVAKEKKTPSKARKRKSPEKKRSKGTKKKE